MNAVLSVLVIGLIAVVAIAAAMVLLAVHIHSEERRQALSQEPRTRAGAVVRRVLGAHASPTPNVNRARAHARR
jgi:hypothetical protein